MNSIHGIGAQVSDHVVSDDAVAHRDQNSKTPDMMAWSDLEVWREVAGSHTLTASEKRHFFAWRGIFSLDLPFNGRPGNGPMMKEGAIPAVIHAASNRCPPQTRGSSHTLQFVHQALGKLPG
jgi:hypothetical protein